MKKQFFIFLLILIFGFSNTLFYYPVLAVNSDIVITEIGAFENSAHEWIEIYNKGADSVNIIGWKFFEDRVNHGLTLTRGDDSVLIPGEYAVIAQNSDNFIADYPDFLGTVFDSAWQTLTETGEEIGLKDGAGSLVELFTYIPAPDFSLQRRDTSVADYSEQNWEQHESGATPGRVNVFGEEDVGNGEEDPVENEDDGSPQNEGSQEENDQSEEEALVNIKILINEFVPIPPDGESEWIELYNPATSSLDLTGWELWDGVGKISAPTSTLAGGSFLVAEISNKLNNGGDIILLKNPLGDVVDSVSFGSWDDGNKEDNASLPTKGNSLARTPLGSDTDNDRIDFSHTTTPTKGADNVISAPAQENPPAGNTGGAAPAPNTPVVPGIAYKKGDIVINELVSDPGDGEVEFVELYNRTEASISLAGWVLEDGSETTTKLTENILSKQFVVIESPKGSLNNAGDTVVLIDPSGQEIDRVTYGTWDDGNVSNNAPAPRDPFGLSRLENGQDSDYDLYDFAVSETLTKGRVNVITSSANGVVKGEKIMAAGVLIINEIFPDPVGSDNEEEFIELYNTGSEKINLAGFKLSDSGTRKYTITQGEILPGAYFVLKRKQTGIALNNSGGDEVRLYQSSDTLLDQVAYTGGKTEGTSYARRDDGSFAWTEKVTPNEKNSIEGKSSVPLIVINVNTMVEPKQKVVFDASDTTHPDNKKMTFAWEFGDGKKGKGDTVEHVYQKEGEYTVLLVVTDENKNSVEEKVIINVKLGNALSTKTLEATHLGILISEIFPNPAGSDNEAEFIELFNPTTEAVDVSGLKIDDEDGGSRAYTFPAGKTVSPGEYLLLTRGETKLALNNTSDAVRLLSPVNEVLLEVEYDSAKEGMSYIVHEEGVYVWTDTATPGVVNELLVQEEEGGTSKKSKKEKPTIASSLSTLRGEDVGDRVQVSGVVTVLPGILGTQIFYIGGEGGVQVYLGNKDFPSLQLGDQVQVVGEIVTAYGETRLKVAAGSDIVVLDSPGEVPAKKVEVAEIGEALEGSFIEIEGEITELKSSYLYLDDGTDEIKVYFKKGASIDRKRLALGQIVRVWGVVGQASSGYQVLPRGQTDIEPIGVAEPFVDPATPEAPVETGVIGATGTYVTATAGGITSIVLGLLAKLHGATVLGWVRRNGGGVVAFLRRGKKG